MLYHIPLVAALLATANPVPADGGPWVGKKVMPIKKGVKLRLPDAAGERVEVPLKGAVYTVAEQKGSTLRLTARGQSGWGDRGDWVPLAEAPAHYTDLTRANPDDPWGWTYRGIAWRERGELDNALKDFERAAKLDPNSAVTQLNLGNVCSSKRYYDQAIRAFDEAVRLDPGYAAAYFNRGNAWKAKGESDKAVADYSEAIRLDPTNPVMYNQRANVRLERGDYDAAVKDYTEAYRHDPGHPGSVYNRSRVWATKGDYRKALDDLDEALRIDPGFDHALAFKARVLASCPDEKYRDGTTAVELARRACDRTRWRVGDALDALAAAYAEVGNFEFAVRYQKRALEDEGFAGEWGDEARARLDLYARKQPYRMEGR